MLRFRPVKTKTSYKVKEHSNVETLLERELRDYYISTVRLVEKNQVDKVVHAFVHMPLKNLIVLYNPSDSHTENVMKIARWANNIFFVHEPLEMRRSAIISSAVASLSIAKQQDFGIEVVESMACGIPAIVSKVWWHKETVISEKTWIFLPDEFSVYNIMEAVEALTPERSLSMKDACIERAHMFALEDFANQMQNYFTSEEETEVLDDLIMVAEKSRPPRETQDTDTSWNISSLLEKDQSMLLH